MFSIITVVKNDADGLLQTARSIERQTFRSFEWIIKDGASSDRTRDAVAALGRRYITLVGMDSGIYDAMNQGLALATGEYLIFLNAGDVLFNDYALAVAAKAIVDHQRPDILFFDTVIEFGTYRRLRPARNPWAYIKYGMPSIHQSTIYSKRVAGDGYSTALKICGDYEFTIRAMATAKAVQLVPTPLVTFAAGGTSTRRWAMLLREAASIQRNSLHLPRRTVLAHAARRVVSRALFSLALLRGRVYPDLRSARFASGRHRAETLDRLDEPGVVSRPMCQIGEESSR